MIFLFYQNYDNATLCFSLSASPAKDSNKPTCVISRIQFMLLLPLISLSPAGIQTITVATSKSTVITVVITPLTSNTPAINPVAPSKPGPPKNPV